MYRVVTDDVDGVLAGHSDLVRAAVDGLLDSARLDPWSWTPAVPSHPTSGLRKARVVADGRKFELTILIVDWDDRVDVVRLRRYGRHRTSG